ETPLLRQARHTGERPVQDPRQLLVQFWLQLAVLASEPTLCEQQRDETAGDCGRRVAQARQLVTENQEPGRQLASPLLSILDVHRQGVLAADGQQPLHHRAALTATQACVGY